ncbi:IclR family transcriptional regulator [Pseudonocardia sp. NPDC046786]|uniref:IclR family transcriptional regulator n=1 Tax=Pseudonocardia sp. NPDC046786 TaxID=3155471 RepID=UPI0033EA1B7F
MTSPITDGSRAARAPAKGAQTLARGIDVLQYVVSAGVPQRPAEIARALDLDRNAVYRLLLELEAHSYLSRLPGNSGYVAGNALIALAAAVMRKVDLRSSARPVMEHITEQTGETVSLHVRSGRERVCVETTLGKHVDRRVIQIGERLPLYAGPSGKAILAFMEPQEVDVVIAEAAAAGSDAQALRTTLASIQERGFVASVGDRSPGVGGLSAPVFQADGIVAALTVSGPSTRWDQQVMEQWAPLVIETCQALSRAIGYTP